MAKDTKAYTPNVWAEGDVISAEKLNHIEGGLANIPAGPKGDKGDAGKDGVQGPKGETGAPGKDGGVTKEQFDALAAEVAALKNP